MYCRKCQIDAGDDAKICRSCGSILDEGPESNGAARDQGLSMSWLDQSPEPIVAVAVENAPENTPQGVDWVCAQCGSTVPRNIDVCWKCVTTDSATERETEHQSELQAFLDQVEAEQPPAEPELVAHLVNEPIEATPDEALQKAIQTQCCRCGSTRMMTNMTIEDQPNTPDNTLKVVVFSDPGAMLFKGAQRSEIIADICGDCGHMELRISNPRQLYRHWRAAY